MICPHCLKHIPARKLSPEQKEKAILRTQLWRLKKARQAKKQTGP